MKGPRELLRRAAANRRREAAFTDRPDSAAPRPAVQSHHATYTALMHSHDRMRTRHLPGQAGEGSA